MKSCSRPKEIIRVPSSVSTIQYIAFQKHDGREVCIERFLDNDDVLTFEFDIPCFEVTEHVGYGEAHLPHGKPTNMWGEFIQMVNKKQCRAILSIAKKKRWALVRLW